VTVHSPVCVLIIYTKHKSDLYYTSFLFIQIRMDSQQTILFVQWLVVSLFDRLCGL